MFKINWPLKNLRGALLLLIVAFHAFSAYIVTQPATPPAFDSPPLIGAFFRLSTTSVGSVLIFFAHFNFFI
jgi:hypothetical protein